MNPSKRLLFQAVFWLILWSIFSFTTVKGGSFMLEYSPLLLLQVVLLIAVIYYATPTFLLKKRYLHFLFFSCLTILLFIGLTSLLLTFTREAPHLIIDNLEAGQPPPLILHSFTYGLIFLVTYLLALFVESTLLWQKREQETLRIKSVALESELKLLKSQINPHFLFNALNNIYSLTAIDGEKTRQSILYLSDMLRYVLYDCESSLVFLQKEVTYIENYLRLFALKSSRKYAIKMEVQMEDSSARIAPMLLIPFVENSLKHSRIEKIKDSYIHLLLKVTKETIYFEIENSVPTQHFNKDEVGGIGLENVKRRLAILYPEQHALSILDNSTTFKVKLTIKFQNHA